MARKNISQLFYFLIFNCIKSASVKLATSYADQMLILVCFSQTHAVNSVCFSYCDVFVICVSDVNDLPERTHDDGAGEQSDERQAVTQSRQNLHHFVEDQLHRNTHTQHKKLLNKKQ